eukprot:8268804-Ditylum_brightwellii.AAC.1
MIKRWKDDESDGKTPAECCLDEGDKTALKLMVISKDVDHISGRNAKECDKEIAMKHGIMIKYDDDDDDDDDDGLKYEGIATKRND